MSLQVGTALQDGIDDLTSQSGVLFAAVFVVLGLLNTVISQSLSLAANEYFISQLDQPEAAMQQPGGFGQGTALAVDVPLAVAAGLLLLLSVVAVTVSIVAIRAFGSDSPEAIPPEATRNLLNTTLIAIVTGIIAGIAQVIGFILLIIPFLILYVLFYFIQQEIALNDSGVIESIQGSIGLVTDNVVGVVVIAIILFVLGILLSVPSILSSGSAVVILVSVVIGQVVSVFNLAVVTSAYQQAAEDRTETAI